VVSPFLDAPRRRLTLYAVTGLLLVGSIGLVVSRTALVLLVVYSHDDEFSVMVDLPEGANLEATPAAAGDAVGHLMTLPAGGPTRRRSGSSCARPAPLATATG